jgi:DNA-nicking Smr family endonuclease
MRSSESDGPAPDWQIDLHGCSVEQGLRKLRMAVQSCRYQRYESLRVVTGRGLGSPGRAGVLAPAVLEWLKSEEARALGVVGARLGSKGGAVEVDLKGSGGEADRE